MSHSAIVFPRPPPTCNTLSAVQRSQLLRSNAKLGQVLGSTPHILDEPFTPPPRSKSRSSRAKQLPPRADSPDSFSSSSTHLGSSTSRSSCDSQVSHTSATSSVRSEKSWRIRFPTRRPPLLRLGKLSSKSKLDPIPGSPANPDASYSQHLSATSAAMCDPGSPEEPSFTIPSDAALRRQKMQRLAKRLGEGVPVNLVFPPSMESDDEDVIVDSPTSDSSSSDDSYTPLWREPSPCRSNFARNSGTVSVVSGQYVIHYEIPGVHGCDSETFTPLSCRSITTIPEE